jgi:hypothetical protein
MEKSLNETIDGLFRGIVFIVLDTVTSAFKITLRPGRAPSELAQRLEKGDEAQVRPYVFAFLTLFVALLFPVLLDAGRPDSDPYAYKYVVDGEDLLRRSYLGKMFDATVEKFEAKSLLQLTVAATLGVSILHLLSGIVIGVLRLLAKKSAEGAAPLFFIVGTQTLLACVAGMVLYQWDDSSSTYLPTASWIGMLFHPYSALYLPYAMGERWRLLWWALCALFIFFLPFFYSLRLVHQSHLEGVVTKRWRLFTSALLVTVLIDALFWVTCVPADALSQKIRTHDEIPYQIKQVACHLEGQNDSRTLVASILVKVTGPDAFSFAKDDFYVGVSARRTKDDPPPRHRPGAQEDRVGKGLGKPTAFNAKGEHSVLLEPGRWGQFELVATVDKAVLEFLTLHPSMNRCGVADANDTPAGGSGSLERGDLPKAEADDE